MVKNLPANAGDMGFNPWITKIPQAMEQLSPGDAIIEPVLWSWESQLQKPSHVRAWAPKQEKTPQ